MANDLDSKVDEIYSTLAGASPDVRQKLRQGIDLVEKLDKTYETIKMQLLGTKSYDEFMRKGQSALETLSKYARPQGDNGNYGAAQQEPVYGRPRPRFTDQALKDKITTSIFEHYGRKRKTPAEVSAGELYGILKGKIRDIKSPRQLSQYLWDFKQDDEPWVSYDAKSKSYSIDLDNLRSAYQRIGTQ